MDVDVDETNLREKVILNLKKIDPKHHNRVYNEILKKHNLRYSKNQNGIFFNMEDISIDVIRELHNYIHFLCKTELKNNHEQFNYVGEREFDVDKKKGSGANVKTEHNNNTTTSNNDECEQVINSVSNNTDYCDVKTILSTLEKDKTSHRKISQNKFLMAKKKFSKQFIADTRNICNELKSDPGKCSIHT